MSRDPARAASQFFGGRVCLDFANTVDWRLTDRPVELVPDYAALLDWSKRRGTLSSRSLARLREHKSEDSASESVMREAFTIRADIWSIAEELIHHRYAQPSTLNDNLAKLPSQPQLQAQRDRYVFDLDGLDLRQPLWPILWSLTSVLTSEDANRIGRCEAQGCGWYFIDESSNHSRKWCSSEVCGNRERVRRSYVRRQTKL